MVVVCCGFVVVTGSRLASTCCIAVLKICQYMCESEVDTFAYQSFEGAIVDIAGWMEELPFID